MSTQWVCGCEFALFGKMFPKQNRCEMNEHEARVFKNKAREISRFQKREVRRELSVRGDGEINISAQEDTDSQQKQKIVPGVCPLGDL